MTRALAALLHGHFADALRWNPLVLLVVAAFLAWVVPACLGRRTAWPKLPDFALVGMLVASAAFMIVRNLP
jgi:dipeptide/tripeptide permease